MELLLILGGLLKKVEIEWLEGTANILEGVSWESCNRRRKSLRFSQANIEAGSLEMYWTAAHF